MENYLHIILSTSGVYVFIIIALRILGKTELAQLSITDLIFVLLISNAVQNAMVGSDTTLGGGILAASVLFILNKSQPVGSNFMARTPCLNVASYRMSSTTIPA